jgi:nucleoside-diphosphate-sugar epimerase
VEKTKVLIVGDNSFVGRNFYNSIKLNDTVIANIIPYSQLHHIDLKRYDVVLNCAITYEYKTQKYNNKYDLDYLVGLKAQEAGCQYIMMSTRKVYGNSIELSVYDELSTLKPFDRYGENKVKTEMALDSLVENLTILRGSNIYGFEQGRSSFVGYCMTQLKSLNIIDYDMDENIKRDFISIDTVSEVLKQVCLIKPKGIFNLSSHYGLPIGEVARFLILGYGSGKFTSNVTCDKEQFILDNRRLENVLMMKITPHDYWSDFYTIGKRLWMI